MSTFPQNSGVLIANLDIESTFYYKFCFSDLDFREYPLLGALAFDVEYARWLEEHNKRINELRGAVNSHAGDGELRIIVDGIVSHYDDIFRIKGDAAKADVFHILSGMWKTPAERCFLWLGGFRSSELLKVSHVYHLKFFPYPNLGNLVSFLIREEVLVIQ